MDTTRIPHHDVMASRLSLLFFPLSRSAILKRDPEKHGSSNKPSAQPGSGWEHVVPRFLENRGKADRSRRPARGTARPAGAFFGFCGVAMSSFAADCCWLLLPVELIIINPPHIMHTTPQ